MKTGRRIGGAGKPRLKLAGWLLLSSAAVAGVLLAGGSLAKKAFVSFGWNKFERLEIIGLERISAKEIEAMIKVPSGADMHRLSLDSVAAVVEQHPAVRSASVACRYPGRLAVRVVERQPVGLVALGGLMLVDGEGSLFPLASQRERLDYPIITGKFSASGSGRLVSAAGGLARIAEGWPEVYENISEIHLSGGETVVRLRQGGALCKLKGGLDEGTLDVLSQFIKSKGELLTEDLSYLDLRFPNMVVVGSE